MELPLEFVPQEMAQPLARQRQFGTIKNMMASKILLVEDDEVLAKVLYGELSDAGFEVFQAFDGEVGLRLAREKQPDLVLLDILLPKKNGFDVLMTLKSSPDTENIPVIALTMLGSDDDIKKGMQLGADDYIVKSQHAVTEIIEKVKEFFAKEQHPRAKQSKPKSGSAMAVPQEEKKRADVESAKKRLAEEALADEKRKSEAALAEEKKRAEAAIAAKNKAEERLGIEKKN